MKFRKKIRKEIGREIRKKVRKAVTVIMIMSFFSVSASGCGGNTVEKSGVLQDYSDGASGTGTGGDEPVQVNGQEGSGEAELSAQPGQSGQLAQPDQSEQTAQAEGTALAGTGGQQEGMEAFLAGKTFFTVKDSCRDDVALGTGTFEPGKTYYREDLIRAMTHDPETGNRLSMRMTKASWARLQVPNAEGEWYCLDIVLEDGMSEAVDSLIFKYLDGALYLCSTFETYYRVNAFVNKYGVVSSGGASGAGSSVENIYLPDASGDYKALYLSNTNYRGWNFYEGESYELPVNDVVEEVGRKLEEEGMDDFAFSVTQTVFGDEYYYSLEAESNDVARMFEEAAAQRGLSLISSEKLSELVEDRARDYGYTIEEVNSNEEPEYEYSEDIVEDEKVLLYSLYPYPDSSEYRELKNVKGVEGEAETGRTGNSNGEGGGESETEGVESNPETAISVSRDGNQVVRVRCELSYASIRLERGEWVAAADSEPDYFNPVETVFSMFPEEGDTYEFQVHMTEGVPDERLVFGHGDFETAWYCIEDGRDPLEREGVTEIYWEDVPEEEFNESDPFMTLAKVCSGMIVSAGSYDELLSGGEWYWRVLSNAASILLSGSDYETEEGISVPAWLLNEYARAMGLMLPEYTEITGNSPVSYHPEYPDTYLIKPEIRYDEDDVELLEMTKNEYGSRELVFVIHGQIEESVVMNVMERKSLSSPFGFYVLSAQMGVG